MSYRLTRAERFKDARIVYNQYGKQTLNEVATATGVQRSLISDLENDEKERNVAYQTIAKLARHYGVSANWLLELSDDYAIIPCATDELCLSTEAVALIRNVINDPNSESLLNSFNTLLGDQMFLGFLRSIDRYFSAVEKQITFLNNKHNKGRAQNLFDDGFIAESLTNELKVAHPNLGCGFAVISGYEYTNYLLSCAMREMEALLTFAGEGFRFQRLMGGEYDNGDD